MIGTKVREYALKIKELEEELAQCRRGLAYWNSFAREVQREDRKVYKIVLKKTDARLEKLDKSD